MKRLLYSLLLFFVTIWISGCVKRELDLPEGEMVHIDFDWDQLSDRQNIPSDLVLRFYSLEGDFLFERHSSPDYFQEYLPGSKYNILIYNLDTTGVRYENMGTFQNAQITISSQQTEDPLETPHNIYGGSLENLTVPTEDSADTEVTLHPYLHLVTVQLKITGSSAELVECSAVMDGVTETVNLSTGSPISGTNSSVSANLYPERGNYQGTFRLAGKDDRYPSVISFKLRFNDGTERIIQQDFADFMDHIDQHESDIPLTVELTIDVQLIDGVFTATLKDWVYKQGEIILN